VDKTLWLTFLGHPVYALAFLGELKRNWLTRERTDIEEMNRRAAEVVITGISGRLPESDNIAEFREHLINGDDMATEDNRRWEPGDKTDCIQHNDTVLYCSSVLTLCLKKRTNFETVGSSKS